MNPIQKLKYLIPLALCSVIGGTPDSPSEKEILPELPLMVITANRAETQIEDVGSSVTVITAETMKKQGYHHVSEALRHVVGIDVVQNGGLGSTATVFIRGAESNHTLVILDGVELNDPVSPGNTFNFGHLSVDQIERIEIVRGPQSTLYGSDAMGGVIHIISKQAGGKPRFEGGLEAGSFNTQKERASFSSQFGRFDLRAEVSHLEQDGFSSADEDLGNLEEDGYRADLFGLRLGARLGDQVRLNLDTRYEDTSADLDNGAGIGGDDPNYIGESEQLTWRARVALNHFDSRWQHQVSVSGNRLKRTLVNEEDAEHPGRSSHSNFEGERLKVDWIHQLYLDDLQLTFGLESEEEQGDSVAIFNNPGSSFESVFTEKSATTNALFLQAGFEPVEHLALTLGARLDDHDQFGSADTYRITGAYRLGDRGSRIHGSYGTAFKAPSLYQLYSAYGDENLQAEESIGWDLGIKGNLGSGWELGITWFENDFDQLIDYDSNLFTYNNIANVNSRGLEVTADWFGNTTWTVQCSYTYTRAMDTDLDQRLVRRPEHKAQAAVSYKVGSRLDLGLQTRYLGERDFNDYSVYPTGRVTLGGLTLFNLTGGFRISDHVALRARIENLGDKNYQEIFGYGTSGRAGYLSLALDY